MPKTRKFGPRAIGESLPEIVGPALRRRGIAAARLISDWPEIIGEDLAADSCPRKLSNSRRDREPGTLHIAVAGAAAVEIQHLEPVLIERINTYLGYRAVARIALRQTPIAPRPRRAPRKKEPPLDREAARALDARMAPIGDADLRAALAALGRAVTANRRRANSD